MHERHFGHRSYPGDFGRNIKQIEMLFDLDPAWFKKALQMPSGEDAWPVSWKQFPGCNTGKMQSILAPDCC